MIKIRKIAVFVLIFILGIEFSYGQASALKKSENDVWQVGIVRKIITPSTSTWMAGYAARTSSSKGTLHDLWAKALTIQDAEGHRSILVTMDLLGIPADFSEKLRNEIKKKHGLENSQIILSSSHTHSGPVLSGALKYIYPLNSADFEAVNKYTSWLETELLELVDESMKQKQPGKIYTQNGIARFQVNRRNNNESQLTSITQLKGLNDYAVPVIKIEGLDKKIMAVVFGYACHPTVLDIYKFSGDYPGFAQIELEKLYPGATAMFFQGAAGDQNPLPRRTIPLAQQYGKELAATVERVLSEDMEKQASKLMTEYKEIDLPFDKPLPLEQLHEISKRDDYQGRWAQGMLDEYKCNGTLKKSYTYPMGYWKIGNQPLFILGGEVVISYAVKLKERFGQNIFVMAYANDVMGYIPSAVIIDEGGYEGDTSQRVYGLPAKWDKQIESLIIGNLEEMAGKNITNNQYL